MKTIRLAFGRILDYAKGKKLIFIIFLTGVVLCSFIFIYFYGNAMPHKRHEAYNQVSLRTFSVEFPEPEQFSEKTLHVLDGFGISDVTVSCKAEIKDLEAFSLEDSLKTDMEFSLRTLRDNNQQKDMFFTDLFSQEQLEGDNIILSNNFGTIDTIQVNGVDFAVSRRIGNMIPSYLYIPAKSFERHGFGIEKIDFALLSRADSATAGQIVAILAETFPRADIAAPDTATPGGEYEAFLTISFQYLLSLLAFLFLFRYLLEQTQYQDVVYTTVGAPRAAVLKIVFTEMALISLFCSLCAVLLHHCTYGFLGDEINTIPNIRYTWADYGICAGVTVALSLFAAAPAVVSYLRYSTAELKRKVNR